MSARHFCLVASVLFGSAVAFATPPAPVPGVYAPQDPCSSIPAAVTTFAVNANGMTMDQALAAGVQCKKDSAAAGPVKSGDGQTAAHSASAADKASPTAFQKYCIQKLQGSSGKCLAFMGQTASAQLKAADDLTKQLNDAHDKVNQAQQTFTNSQQQLTDHYQSQQALIAVTIPSEKTKATLAANQNYQDGLVKANDSFTQLQNQYTNAQATYNKAMSDLQTSCYNTAQDAYKQAQAKVDACKAGRGCNVSSSVMVQLSNRLKSFQTDSYRACLSNVASVQKANQNATDLANAKAQLNQQVAALNVTRANLKTQLNTQLATITTDANAKAQLAAQQMQQDQVKMQMLAQNFAKEQANNDVAVTNLTNQIAQAQETASCIESYSGTVSKDTDSDANPQVAFSTAVQATQSCYGSPNKCRDAGWCSGVPTIDSTLATALNITAPSAATTTDQQVALTPAQKAANLAAAQAGRQPATKPPASGAAPQ